LCLPQTVFTVEATKPVCPLPLVSFLRFNSMNLCAPFNEKIWKLLLATVKGIKCVPKKSTRLFRVGSFLLKIIILFKGRFLQVCKCHTRGPLYSTWRGFLVHLQTSQTFCILCLSVWSILLQKLTMTYGVSQPFPRIQLVALVYFSGPEIYSANFW